MASTSGFMLGVVGGILDFASATSLLFNQPTQSGMMGTGISYTELAIGLYLLGVLVIATSLISTMLIGMRFPRLFSVLMVAYGVVMAAVGWAMLSEMASTEISSLYTYGMIIVGALMLINGVLMLRTRVEM